MFKDSRGFTLVELLVVIGLGAILLVLALSSLNTSRIKTRDNIRVSNIQEIRLALEQYRLVCGVFPATLSLEANNGRSGTCSARLGDFISVIPTVPPYPSVSSNMHSQQGSEYLYTGLSTQANGPCYDYHIAVQLEYGADNAYGNGESSEFLNVDHDYNPLVLNAPYGSLCAGAEGPLITGAEDDRNGLYDFRSSQSESQ